MFVAFAETGSPPVLPPSHQPLDETSVRPLSPARLAYKTRRGQLTPAEVAAYLAPAEQLLYREAHGLFTEDELGTIKCLAIIAGGWWFHRYGQTLHQLAAENEKVRVRCEEGLALGLVTRQSCNRRYVFTTHAWELLDKYY